MNDAALFDRTFVPISSSRVRLQAFASSPIICVVHAGERLAGHMVRGIAHRGANQWARVRLPSGVVGYVWGGYGSWELEIKA